MAPRMIHSRPITIGEIRRWFPRGARKRRLLACACVRQFWTQLSDPRSRRCVEAAEWYAEGLGASEPLYVLHQQGIDAVHSVIVQQGLGVGWKAALAAANTCNPRLGARNLHILLQTCILAVNFQNVQALREGIPLPEHKAHRELLREIAGPRLRQKPLDPHLLVWNDRLIVRLAESVDRSQQFGDLPLLHDALLDAGCQDQDLLEHCRRSVGHVRGCWAVDRILGRCPQKL